MIENYHPVNYFNNSHSISKNLTQGFKMNKLLQKIGRLDSLPMKGRKRWVWKLKKIFKIPETDFESDFYGFKYNGNTRNQIDKYVYYFGAYEKGMLRLIEEEIKKTKEKIFADVGANIGHHSLFASRIAKQVYSFEPYEKVRKELENKLRINKINNVQVIPFALGEEDQELEFYEPGDMNTGTGSFIQGYLPENKKTGLKLQVKNGNQLFKELMIQNISVIKVDTEGFEPLVLSGLLPILERDKPIIVMEYSDGTDKLLNQRPDLLAFLKKEYQFFKFKDPNEFNYVLIDWDFKSLGNLVLKPKR